MSNSLYVNNDGASLSGNTDDDSSLVGDQNTKKVLFNDPNPVLDLEMVDGSSPTSSQSRKEMLLRKDS
ncbi:hypothetical protein Goklo_008200 [Gossypium klotzschianum]|uniref:Uncharacterized protein n=1 Tax=Gossypium klotzschianum TaxID=34286 RepID=A0A7J8UZ16_9ROSI|nr:hypothetical protein [Gossypium klotzschianum]